MGSGTRAQKLHHNGVLAERTRLAVAALDECTLCPRMCRADRSGGSTGVCGIARHARVASYTPHFGEEQPLVGGGGSGTVFFSGCNLRCSFCQNSSISHHPAGPEMSADAIASVMLELQAHGCVNINLVTPSHVVPQILEALSIALDGGLAIPIVYNTSGYDSVQTLRLLDGVVDIYLPDFKFWTGEGVRYLDGVTDYAERAIEAITEMHRQVGDLHIVRGVAVSGLLVRHLVMPRQVADTASIMSFVASLSPETYVNVMDQYHPHHLARNDPEIGAATTYREHAQAIDAAHTAGIARIDGYL